MFRYLCNFTLQPEIIIKHCQVQEIWILQQKSNHEVLYQNIRYLTSHYQVHWKLSFWLHFQTWLYFCRYYGDQHIGLWSLEHWPMSETLPLKFLQQQTSNMLNILNTYNKKFTTLESCTSARVGKCFLLLSIYLFMISYM